MTWTDQLTLHTEPVHHYARADINAHAPEAEREALWRWMRGQTCLLRDDGDTGVYKWDFDRWVAQGRKTEQGMDWD